MLNRRDLLGAAAAAAFCRWPIASATTCPVLDGDQLKHELISLPPGAVEAARGRLGDYGVISIRSADRLDRLLKVLVELGWKKTDFSLAATNWKSQTLVGVIDCGDEGNSLSLGPANPGGDTTNLDLFMSYVIYKQRGRPVNVPKILLTQISTPSAKIAVKTFHPESGGPYPTKEKSHAEWIGVVGPDVGDSVGGLRAKIAPEARAVKLGEDIRLTFTLELASDEKDDGAFARRGDQLFIWDGKYSEGYRNHAFQVIKPDGSVAYLRPAVREFDKNAPHPVAISAAKPYTLPNWFEGQTLKSLKELKFDAADRGKYQITGVYSEQGGVSDLGEKRQLWSGALWSNTVTVEVI